MHDTLPTLRITIGTAGILSELTLVRPLPLESMVVLLRDRRDVRPRGMDRRAGLAIKKPPRWIDPRCGVYLSLNDFEPG
jgi:hypothetical protein